MIRTILIHLFCLSKSQLADYCECKEMPKDDLEPYLLRVGWSLYESSLQLGFYFFKIE